MATIECICPPVDGGQRHPEGDVVTFKVPMDYPTAAKVQHAISVLRMERDPDEQGEIETEEFLAKLTEAYMRFGIVEWTLVDAAGKAIPVTPANVERYLFSDITAAMVVGDEADGLYSRAILAPLLKRASNSSPATLTPDSTSQPTGSQPTPDEPMPSKPSSTSTTPTDDTETTSESPGIGSSSSPSLVSVA